jgi:hypothetical protein
MGESFKLLVWDCGMAEMRSIIDFGLVVLIWLVQMVIYPSFSRCDREKLRAWHKSYTTRISMIVIPLMLAQMVIIGYQVWVENSWLNMASALGVVGCWASTFCLSVPIHKRIQDGMMDDMVLRKLVWTNWPRTILWTLAFVLGMA